MELRTEGLKAQDPQYERGGSRAQAKERQREQMGMIWGCLTGRGRKEGQNLNLQGAWPRV